MSKRHSQSDMPLIQDVSLRGSGSNIQDPRVRRESIGRLHEMYHQSRHGDRRVVEYMIGGDMVARSGSYTYVPPLASLGTVSLALPTVELGGIPLKVRILLTSALSGTWNYLTGFHVPLMPRKYTADKGTGPDWHTTTLSRSRWALPSLCILFALSALTFALWQPEHPSAPVHVANPKPPAMNTGTNASSTMRATSSDGETTHASTMTYSYTSTRSETSGQVSATTNAQLPVSVPVASQTSTSSASAGQVPTTTDTSGGLGGGSDNPGTSTSGSDGTTDGSDSGVLPPITLPLTNTQIDIPPLNR